ncbi:dihydrofolate reductase [Variovorax boronicumulans]|uniref:Dihydrofolate reductase n=1 Tax=Variovorax boronicumulans TaxID=436515 RepID=A0AAW8E506_9BURK|nr:dihydrofolate reductase family protein [Variovorax boronicumulans]MDP9881704.1 dihydrofolate reductase [Variovorax boronicumulans]MDP9914893.1 dihydrofolate reductase [Variovorax boronicumulans]MDP9926983.1 dihydrofolate reductase [Variovorax boronicumulans]
MRKLIVQMQMSVDGFVSPAYGDLDWQLWGWGDRWRWDAALKRDFNAVFAGVDTLLLSRKIIEEGYLDHWGRAATRFLANPDYAFAQRIVEARKVVLTNKLQASRWERTDIARGAMADEVNALKRQPGQDILTIGGVGFASSLTSAGLVDEFQFFVNPTAVGAGRSVFHDTRHGHALRLLGSTAYDCGMVVNRYAPA